MYTIQKTIHFAAAHRLMRYEGACRNIHGHNFFVTVTLEANEIADISNGFVYDVKLINQFKQVVEEKYDHAFLTQQGDEIGEFLSSRGQKVVFLDCPPSIENLAKQLFDEFLLDVSLPTGVVLKAIQVQETPTISAEYTGKSVSGISS